MNIAAIYWRAGIIRFTRNAQIYRVRRFSVETDLEGGSAAGSLLGDGPWGSVNGV